MTAASAPAVVAFPGPKLCRGWRDGTGEFHLCGAPVDPGRRFLCGPCYDAEQRENDRLASIEACQAREGLRERMGAPRRYVEDPPRNHITQPTMAMGKVWTWVEHQMPRGRALVLAGPTGVGKTEAASAVIDYFAYGRYVAARWFFVPKLLRQLADFGERDDAMAEALKPRVLILDDLGHGPFKPGGQAESLLEEIIAERADEERAMLATTNLTPERLADLFSDRLIDRLRAWAEIYVCAGPSLRKPPA